MDSVYICGVLLNGRFVFSIKGVIGMTRGEILDKAKEIITKDRVNRYGEPENTFGVIAKLWSIYLEQKVEAEDVAMLMALLKIGRLAFDIQNEDSLLDAIGYLACAGELIGENEWEN